MSHRNDRTLAVSALARVEGEGAMHVRVRGGVVEDVRLEIYEPPGSSRRSCAGGGTPSHPTSPPASAGSARWLTR